MRLVNLLLLFPSICFAGDWSKEDTYRQTTFTGLMILDWAQTRTIAKNPDRFQELNKIEGQHPTLAKINTYHSVGIIGHAAVSYILPRSYRETWQYVWIGIEVEAVRHNYRMGIRMDF